MIDYRSMRWTMLFAIGLMLLSVGCASTKQSSFYTLQAVPSSTESVWSRAGERRLSIGVGPVILADYLDRPQIITRTGPNELKLAEYDRWAGPLTDNIERVLAENLAIMLNTDRIVVYPWENAVQVEYQIKLDVQQFDGTLGGQASLVVWWTIYGQSGDKLLLAKKSNLSTPVADSTYKTLVSAENQILIELSREIAYAIKTLAEAGSSG